MPRPSVRTILFDRGGLIGLVALALYIVVAPAHIVDGDNAEMATLGTVGGAAHPTGYPAYLIWLRLTSWLPGSTPAHTTAIATAILGAASLVVLQAACRAWGARRLVATLTAAMFGAAPVVLRYNTEAEAFALNNLVVAAILWLAAMNGPLRGTWRVAVLAAVAGIGLCDHVSCLLAAPVGILGAVRGIRESRDWRIAIAAGIGSLALALTPYVYLLATRETLVAWGGIDSLGHLYDHMMRRAYGGAGSFARGGELHPAANLIALFANLGRAWLWLPLGAGLAMLGYRTARADSGEPVWGWRILALAFVIAGPVLAVRFNLDPVGMGLYVVRRFHLLAMLLLAPAVAIALDRAGDWLGPRIRIRQTAVVAIVIVGFVADAATALPAISRVRTPAADHALRHLLGELPPNAVAMVSGDMTFIGTGYLQDAMGIRPDVVIVLWSFVGLWWYRDRLAAHGIAIDTREDGKPSVRIAEDIMASGRPLFVDISLGNVLKELPSYPYGTLFRVLPRGTTPPPITEVAAMNRAWFEKLDLDYPTPSVDDEYPAEIHAGYAETWRIIAEALAAAGHRDEARAAAQVSRQIGPQP